MFYQIYIYNMEPMHDEQTKDNEEFKAEYDKNSKTHATFTFNGEDHTLGNLLRSVIATKYIDQQQKHRVLRILSPPPM